MARQIVKQPNGKLALWSTVIDDFVAYDATEEQIVNLMVKEEAENIALRVREVVQQLEDGEKPYRQFTKTFDECASLAIANHGRDCVGYKLNQKFRAK